MSCPSSVIVPPADFFQTGQAVHQLGLTVALNAGEADDLTRANVKVDIVAPHLFLWVRLGTVMPCTLRMVSPG